MTEGYALEPREIPVLLTIFMLYEQKQYMYDRGREAFSQETEHQYLTPMDLTYY